MTSQTERLLKREKRNTTNKMMKERSNISIFLQVNPQPPHRPGREGRKGKHPGDQLQRSREEAPGRRFSRALARWTWSQSRRGRLSQPDEHERCFPARHGGRPRLGDRHHIRRHHVEN